MFCVVLWHSVLTSTRARRRVCGRAVLRGGVRVAGARSRVRWLCPIRKPHNKRIKPTAFGVSPSVSLCQRAWSCGGQYLARGGGGLYACRYAARRQRGAKWCARSVSRQGAASCLRLRGLAGQCARGGTHGRVRRLCPIHKPHNKRIQPTASLAALASRRLMRVPLGGTNR